MKNRSNVIFRVDAGMNAGFGHLSRCTTLAHALEEYDIKSSFVVNTDNNCLVHDFISNKKLNNYNVNVCGINSLIDDANHTANEFHKGYNFLILDHYNHNIEYQNILRRKDVRWAQFDYHKQNRIKADVIINPNIGITDEEYSNLREPHSILCVGEKYSIIRRDLIGVEYTPNIKRVLIAMGAGEYPKEVISLIKLIITNKSFHFDIISNCRELDELKELTNVTVYSNPSDVIQIYKHSRIAVVSGGVTSHELAYLGIPMFIVPYAENHKVNAVSCEDKKLGLRFNDTNEFIQYLKIKSLELIISELEDECNNNKEIIDGLGAHRISAVISNSINHV